MKRVIYTDNPKNEIWSLLGLFESKKFVSDKLVSKFPSITEDDLNIRTDEITYSIRQAREFFTSSDQVSLLTRPLLLSYGMLNLGKALVFYKSPEHTNFEKYFKQHGLKFIKNTSNQLLANEYIEIKDSGTYPEISSIFNQQVYSNMRISIKDLLSQIPDIADMFCLVYKEYPHVRPLNSRRTVNSIGGLEEYFDKYYEKIEGIQQYLFDNKVLFQTFHFDEFFSIEIFAGMGPDRSLDALDLSLTSIAGVEYFRTFPLNDLRPLILKEVGIHYLLIFSYGMLARYHSSLWGKYIDPNFSNEAEIINKSIHVCKLRYLHLLVNYLFDEEIQFRNSVETPEIISDKSYRELKNRLYRDIQQDLF